MLLAVGDDSRLPGRRRSETCQELFATLREDSGERPARKLVDTVGVYGDPAKWFGFSQVNTGGFTQSTNITGAPLTIGGNKILAFSDSGSAITANGSVTLKGVNYAVPEPGEWAAMGILGAGLGGLVIRARKRRIA